MFLNDSEEFRIIRSVKLQATGLKFGVRFPAGLLILVYLEVKNALKFKSTRGAWSQAGGGPSFS